MRERRRRKGDSNMAYMIGLIVIVYLAWHYIVPSMMFSHTDPLVKTVNNVVYLMRDSIELSVQFLETSARYSVYQAMYDSGKRGLLAELDEVNSVNYNGETFALWGDDESTPTRSDVLSLISDSFDDNFDRYVSRGTITEIIPVMLPSYGNSTITSADNYEVRIEVPSDGNLVISNVITEREILKVTDPADIDMVVHAPFMQLYEEAKEVRDFVLENADSCDRKVLDREIDSWCCSFSTVLLEHSEEICMVMVTGSTKKEFLVWNGTDTSLEPIKLVFVEYSGDLSNLVFSGSGHSEKGEVYDEQIPDG